MKKMRIRIGGNGQTTVRVEGATGDDCLDFTRSIEHALGVVQERKRIDESCGLGENIIEQPRVDTKD